MQLSDHLFRENVAVNLAFSSKKDLLDRLAALAAERLGVEKEPVENALAAREGLGSTGIGQGIAIPHAIINGLEQSVCLFVRLSKPIDFDAVDDIPVDLVLLLLSPPFQQGQSLNILACVARRLRDESLAMAVRQARTEEEAYVLLTAPTSSS